jgi:hypothetical protein
VAAAPRLAHEKVGHLLPHHDGLRAVRDVQELGPLELVLLGVPLRRGDRVLFLFGFVLVLVLVLVWFR